MFEGFSLEDFETFEGSNEEPCVACLREKIPREKAKSYYKQLRNRLYPKMRNLANAISERLKETELDSIVTLEIADPPSTTSKMRPLYWISLSRDVVSEDVSQITFKISDDRRPGEEKRQKKASVKFALHHFCDRDKTNDDLDKFQSNIIRNKDRFLSYLSDLGEKFCLWNNFDYSGVCQPVYLDGSVNIEKILNERIILFENPDEMIFQEVQKSYLWHSDSSIISNPVFICYLFQDFIKLLPLYLFGITEPNHLTKKLDEFEEWKSSICEDWLSLDLMRTKINYAALKDDFDLFKEQLPEYIKEVYKIAKHSKRKTLLPHLSHEAWKYRELELKSINFKNYPINDYSLKILSAITQNYSIERALCKEIENRYFKLDNNNERFKISETTFSRQSYELNDIEAFTRRGKQLLSEDPSGFNEWLKITEDLFQFKLDLKKYGEANALKTVESRIENLNHQFRDFLKMNYPKWVIDRTNGPMLSVDVPGKIKNTLDSGSNVLFLVFDGMSLEQWLEISYKIPEACMSPYFAVLPTSTVFARNSLFSGMFPSQIANRYGAGYLNNNYCEHEMLSDFLSCGKLYRKLIGENIDTDIEDLIVGIRNKRPLVIGVFKFLDDYMHKLANEKKMPIMKWYDICFKDTFENHNIVERVIQFAKNKNYKILLTSDHGNVKTTSTEHIKTFEPAITKSRYLETYNITPDYKTSADFLWIENPVVWGLPNDGNLQYLIASKYIKFGTDREKIPITHGGISLQEVIVPFVEI